MKEWIFFKVVIFFLIDLFKNTKTRSLMITKLEMCPDPTRTYFWPAVKKRPTLLWPGYFLIWPNDIFLTRRAKNWKIECFKGKFSKSIPKPKMADPTRVKIFWPGPIITQNKLTMAELHSPKKLRYPPILNPSWASLVFQTSQIPYLSKMFDPWTSLYEYLSQDWWLCLLKESQIIRDGPWPDSTCPDQSLFLTRSK